MKTKDLSILLATCLGMLLTSEASPLAQHTGATNPTNEAFSAYVGPQATVGPVTGDLGMSAWSTYGFGSSTVNYWIDFTGTQQTQIATGSWLLSITVRIVESASLPNRLLKKSHPTLNRML